MTTKKPIKQVAEEIEEIYQDYETQMKKLKEEQEEVLDEFRSSLEKNKIKEIKKTIDN